MSPSNEVDKSDMMSIVSHFSSLLVTTSLDNKAISWLASLCKDGVKGICFLGMGGSSIAGRYVASLLSSSSPVPMFLVQNYSLPAFVDEDYVTIAVSYSGNTQETLAAHEAALKRGCGTVAVTSGGKLSNAEAGLKISLPGGYPPRGVLPIMLSLLLPTAEILTGQTPTDFNKVKDELNRMSAQKSAQNSEELAHRIEDRIPLFVGADHLFPVAYRAKCQINENAKAEAFASPIPESNHNEIEGFTSRGAKTLLPILLRSRYERDVMGVRMDFMDKMLGELGYDYVVCRQQSETLLGEVLGMTHYLDTVSVALALRLGADPMSIEKISKLKAFLKESQLG
jgi:glucose/mannose-6-phosphate isomerase